MMGQKMTLAQVREFLPDARYFGEILDEKSQAINHFVTDSRIVQPGDFFISIKGERFDGNLFVKDVLAAGAVGALTSDENQKSDGVWLVPNTLESMQKLAAAWRRYLDVQLAVVTGSNGKTTVKEMIASIFKVAAGELGSLSTQGNLNNEIGLPLTLLRLRGDHRYAVIELGMNHPGETQVLAKIAQADIALINNAQREHQEFMETVLAVAQEHASVIDALAEDGIAVFPADSEYSELWRKHAGNRLVIDFEFLKSDIKTISSSASVYGYWTDAGQLKIHTKEFGLIPAAEFEVQLNILGDHNATNALAATAVALAAGISAEHISSGLEKFKPVSGRMQTKPLALYQANGLLIDDTYNANPDSVIAAIDVLSGLSGSRWLVLGDMGEVGANGPAFHHEIGVYARKKGIDYLFTTGELSKASSDGFLNATPNALQKNHIDAWHFDDVSNLNTALSEQVNDFSKKESVKKLSILVKGSRFTKMERVVNNLLGEVSACC